MPLNDKAIRQLIADGYITNATDVLNESGVISHGVSSYGYDPQLSTKFFFLKEGLVPLDPKDHRPDMWEERIYTEPFVVPGGTFFMGSTVETFIIPDNCLVIALGKSTYARCGLNIHVTPLEPGWEGTVTLEFTTPPGRPMVIYPNEGICQFVYLDSTSLPATTYRSRGGKYMGQQDVTHARVRPSAARAVPTSAGDTTDSQGCIGISAPRVRHDFYKALSEMLKSVPPRSVSHGRDGRVYVDSLAEVPMAQNNDGASAGQTLSGEEYDAMREHLIRNPMRNMLRNWLAKTSAAPAIKNPTGLDFLTASEDQTKSDPDTEGDTGRRVYAHITDLTEELDMQLQRFLEAHPSVSLKTVDGPNGSQYCTLTTELPHLAFPSADDLTNISMRCDPRDKLIFNSANAAARQAEADTGKPADRIQPYTPDALAPYVLVNWVSGVQCPELSEDAQRHLSEWKTVMDLCGNDTPDTLEAAQRRCSLKENTHDPHQEER